MTSSPDEPQFHSKLTALSSNRVGKRRCGEVPPKQTDTMKNYPSTRRLAALILSVLTLVTPQAGILDLLKGEATEPTQTFQRVGFVGRAVVKEVTGAAEHLVGIDRWKSLAPGAKLSPGDVIRTKNGSVILRMTESESFVKVTPFTMLRMVPLNEDWGRGVLSGREEKEGYVVRSCRGKAYRRTETGWEPVKVNSVLASKTELRTEAGSIVDLLDTESRQPVRIRGSSNVTLGRPKLAGRTIRAGEFAAVGGR